MPSENVTPTTSDRRSRKREARHRHLLDLAAELVDRHGVDGVTMAALAEAADYAPASLYTYFPSRSALLADLQDRALRVLGDVAADHRAAWDDRLAEHDVDDRVAALARLVAFADLFLTAPEHHAREFRLQQQLLVTPGAESPEDANRVAPAAFAVLAVPRDLLVAAAEAAALHPGDDETDPLGEQVDVALVRTLAWVVALNGALLTDGLVTGLPTTGGALGRHLTHSLLRGWGATGDHLDEAVDLVATWNRGTP